MDHLVLLRRGEIVAIDFKWHSQDLSARMLAAAAAARSAARRASLVLRTLHLPHEAEPLVVCWGGIQSEIRAATAVVADSIDFVAGNDLLRWLERRTATSVLDQVTASATLLALEGFKTRVQPERHHATSAGRPGSAVRGPRMSGREH